MSGGQKSPVIPSPPLMEQQPPHPAMFSAVSGLESRTGSGILEMLQHNPAAVAGSGGISAKRSPGLWMDG